MLDACLGLPGSTAWSSCSGPAGGAGRATSSSSSSGGGIGRIPHRPNLPEAMQMLNALPESVKGCLLEAARLCGPAAAPRRAGERAAELGCPGERAQPVLYPCSCMLSFIG